MAFMITLLVYFENDMAGVETQTKTITILSLTSELDLIVKITPVPPLSWRKW